MVSGPYKFACMVNYQYYKFVPNARYGGHKATATLIYQYEASDNAEFAALQSRQINYGYLPPSMVGAAGKLKGLYTAWKSARFCW